ncbi:hypothetical protein AVEN_31240-1 [Araneus ventricosus]|uniref:Uncharacterized protein n=1 Tax=Araneus ventricosus TaxID=182803 RepID=A0A4Y2X310_ARAVE|nr:hypothetical protein AVEN_31240-1 [Araneus ventricosus]
MRSMKQTERQLLLMESSLAYPRGKEGKSKNSKGRQNSKGDQTLGYLGVVKPVTPKEDVPLRGQRRVGICEIDFTLRAPGICEENLVQVKSCNSSSSNSGTLLYAVPMSLE